MYPYIRKQLTLLMYLPSRNSNNIYNIFNVPSFAIHPIYGMMIYHI